MKATKAELLRWLTPGKEVRLVQNLLGPCDSKRIVKRVKRSEVEFTTPSGSSSFLILTPSLEVEKTSKGYRIVRKDDGECCAEYLSE